MTCKGCKKEDNCDLLSRYKSKTYDMGDFLKNVDNYIQDIEYSIKKSDIVLDIGCGCGTISCKLASKCKKVVGIDISKKSIMKAKSLAKRLKIKNVKFIEGNIMTKRFIKKFDGIIIVNSFDCGVYRISQRALELLKKRDSFIRR